MQQYISVISIFCVFSIGAAPTMHVRQSDVTQAALPIYVYWIGQETQQQKRLCERFTTCLSHSGQFAPTLERRDAMPRVRETLRSLFQDGYMLAVFVGCNESKLEWRLYDVADGKLLHSTSIQSHTNERFWIYTAAQSLWKALTQQHAPFLSHITYVKEVPYKHGRRYSLCIADFDGSYEQELLCQPRYIMSPEWGRVDGAPVIFYSEFTSHNVRICMTDLHGNARVLFDLDGTSVGFVQNGGEMVYCRSGIIWCCYYDSNRNKRVHKPLIREAGTCASPTLDEAGNIYYCHGGMIKHYDRKHGIARAVLYRGYCVAPAYNVQQQSLAYTQRANGTMQIFIYTPQTKEKQQITYDRGDKLDPRRSACGKYVVYTNARDSRVHIYNIATGVAYTLEPTCGTCRSPTWSPTDVYVT